MKPISFLPIHTDLLYIKEMMENMSEEDQVEFRNFLDTYFTGIGNNSNASAGGRRIVVE